MSDMSENKSNNVFKIVIGILILLLIGAIIFGFSNVSKLKDAKTAFEVERSIKVEELKSLQTQYDGLIAEDAANKEEILAANERITKLIDSVGNLEANAINNVALMDKLRKSKAYYQREFDKLKAENEVLKQENSLLNTQKDSLSTELVSASALNDSITLSNVQLKEVVTRAQELQISNLAPSAKRIKDSNKVVDVSKAKKATGFEVCFDVAANKVAEQGDKELYIQVLDPTQKVFGGQFSVTEGEKKIVFSKVAKFRFTSKAMNNVCDFVEPLDNEAFMAGTYTINLYNRTTLIQTSKVSLK